GPRRSEQGRQGGRLERTGRSGGPPWLSTLVQGRPASRSCPRPTRVPFQELRSVAEGECHRTRTGRGNRHCSGSTAEDLLRSSRGGGPIVGSRSGLNRSVG